MDENKPRNQSSDEVDLSQVFKWIGNGFRNVGYSILKGLAGIRSLFFDHKKFFGLIIISGLIIGGLYSRFLNRKYYKSSMILSCEYLNRRIVESSIEKLNLLCGEAEHEGLAKELNIPLESAKNILKFESKPFVSEDEIVEFEVLKEQLGNIAGAKKEIVAKVISKLEIGITNSYQISILITNPDVVHNLDSSIVKYFKSTNYIRKRIDNRKSSLLLKKEKLQQESKRLDSLKSVLFRSFDNMAKQSKQGSNNVILSEKPLTDPLSVFAQDLDFYNQIQVIDRSLYLQPDFEVIDGFTAFTGPASASLLRILTISFLVSWIAGYLFLGLYKFDRYLSKLSKKSN